jgi:hypothetical protein
MNLEYAMNFLPVIACLLLMGMSSSLFGRRAPSDNVRLRVKRPLQLLPSSTSQSPKKKIRPDESKNTVVKLEPLEDRDFSSADTSYFEGDDDEVIITGMKIRSAKGCEDDEGKEEPEPPQPEDEKTKIIFPHPLLPADSDGAPQQGLKANREFKEKELITLYEGEFITPAEFRRDYQQRYSEREWASLKKLQYLVTVSLRDSNNRYHTKGYIDGFQNPGGLSLGSLVNHTSEDNANAELKVLTHRKFPTYQPSRRYQVAVIAKKPIKINDEILIYYGGKYGRELESMPGYNPLTPNAYLEKKAIWKWRPRGIRMTAKKSRGEQFYAPRFEPSTSLLLADALVVWYRARHATPSGKMKAQKRPPLFKTISLEALTQKAQVLAAKQGTLAGSECSELMYCRDELAYRGYAELATTFSRLHLKHNAGGSGAGRISGSKGRLKEFLNEDSSKSLLTIPEFAEIFCGATLVDGIAPDSLNTYSKIASHLAKRDFKRPINVEAYRRLIDAKKAAGQNVILLEGDLKNILARRPVPKSKKQKTDEESTGEEKKLDHSGSGRLKITDSEKPPSAWLLRNDKDARRNYFSTLLTREEYKLVFETKRHHVPTNPMRLVDDSLLENLLDGFVGKFAKEWLEPARGYVAAIRKQRNRAKKV